MYHSRTKTHKQTKIIIKIFIINDNDNLNRILIYIEAMKTYYQGPCTSSTVHRKRSSRSTKAFYLLLPQRQYL